MKLWKLLSDQSTELRRVMTTILLAEEDVRVLVELTTTSEMLSRQERLILTPLSHQQMMDIYVLQVLAERILNHMLFV